MIAMPNKQIISSLILSLAMLPETILAQKAPPEANYDESKITFYTLPDPLLMSSGSRVTDVQTWRKRRSEILSLFETQVYGRSPRSSPRITFTETLRDKQALNGIATRKEVTVFLLGRKNGPKMHLMLYVPNRRTQPAPAFLGMNFNGNHSVHSDPSIAMSTAWMRQTRDSSVVNNRATEASRGIEASRWQLEMVLSRGYAVSTFYYGDLFPDHKDGLPDSIIPHFYRQGQSTIAGDDWNAISAWAWGLSRAMDYLELDKDIDAKRVALWGHSRLGKTALWAGAQDERFAVVISNDSGEGGAALSRRNIGETVAHLNYNFPHWFCGNYKKYSDNVASLPVDQHMLIALVAPRPVYIASASEDLWADPRGEFLSGKAASATFRLLGADGLAAEEMPGLHQPVMSTIGYHLRAGKHDVTKYDWEQFLNFANKYLQRK